MFEGIKKFLEEQGTKKRINQIRNNRRVWEFSKHSSWGDSIQLFGKFENRRITGFISNPSIKDGDELHIDTLKGVFVFAIKNLEYENDPRDMFFANITDIGYLEWLKKQETYTNKTVDDSKSLFSFSF